MNDLSKLPKMVTRVFEIRDENGCPWDKNTCVKLPKGHLECLNTRTKTVSLGQETGGCPRRSPRVFEIRARKRMSWSLEYAQKYLDSTPTPERVPVLRVRFRTTSSSTRRAYSRVKKKIERRERLLINTSIKKIVRTRSHYCAILSRVFLVYCYVSLRVCPVSISLYLSYYTQICGVLHALPGYPT